MHDEGYIAINSRRFGLLAGLRRKQWWSFEGLDPQQKLYFVFLALQAFPSDYVSLKVIDYQNDRRWTEDHLGHFQTSPGEAVDVSAAGKWGQLRFCGRSEEGWDIDVQTPHVTVHCRQTPQAAVHRNWLLTQHLDYTIQQFIMNRTEGSVQFEGQTYSFAGCGYCEHNWGVQPRHSTAHWLHFWGAQTAGVVLNCHYDAGVPHHYTYLWHQDQGQYLHSPAQFDFDPNWPDLPSQVRSPDLELHLCPLITHHSQMQIPPKIAYIDIDYYEQLLEVQGTAWIQGQTVPINGLGKLDHNWNRW
jgi:hypothetical protein